MQIRQLSVTCFRNYTEAVFEPADHGLTVVAGGNGQGKSNLLEAISYLATLQSFRGAPNGALVQVGAERATVRAEGARAGREILVETELNTTGRDRYFVNRQPVKRARDLLGALRATTFSPDDLTLVKGGPGERRRLLDDTLVALHPKYEALRSDLDRVLRQRNTLLKQAGGRLTPDVVSTLDVWDMKLADLGEALVTARSGLVADLEPATSKAYSEVAATGAEVAMRYAPSWEGPLAAALAASRADDVRRALTLVGPHRDDLVIELSGLPSRTHASQGEQRSLAIALRLATHRVVTTAIDDPPVLLLDDVFSELDPDRSEALIAHLPAGQAILTTAGDLPPGAVAARTVRVRAGSLS